MIKIAGTKSNDKINFKEFVDFFYKVDWAALRKASNLLATTAQYRPLLLIKQLRVRKLAKA